LSELKRLLQIIVVSGIVAQAIGQNLSPPNVPEKIKAPAGEELVLRVHASGSQIYVCQPGADGKLAWNLKAPEAELRDDTGALVGHHFAGPTWKHNDGSEITGKAAARVDSPDPNAIPWLLLSVTAHSGNGVLGRVNSVQRINTKGGLAPPAAGCTAATQNQQTESSYTADYYFYASAK
jgi:hypothetical protein